MNSNGRSGRRPTLLCYGDSNTHGTKAMRHADDVRRYRSDTRWPTRLAARLNGGAQVIEAGQPGRTTVHDDPIDGAHKNGLTVLPAVLETHRPISAVLLMLGTNDLKARFSVTPVDVARSVERLVRLVAQSHAGPNGTAPKAVVIAPVPIEECGFLGETFAGGAGKSRALARLYAEMADRVGCGFIDAGSCAAVDPVDGVHLTASGHESLAATLLPYVRQYLL